jgi:hypothetical protein
MKMDISEMIVLEVDGTGSGSCVLGSFVFGGVENSRSDRPNSGFYYLVVYSSDNVLQLLLPFGNFVRSLFSYEASIPLNTRQGCGRRSSKHLHMLSGAVLVLNLQISLSGFDVTPHC